jgi:ABC-type lipopolysaccharide export system ATPase subunit
MTHTLEADSVDLSFGLRRILSDVYLKCETGKITGLLGRNGQGKTCLMNIICGSMDAANRSVRFDGKTIFKAFKKPELLLYLPQFNFIPEWLTLKRVFKDFKLDFSELEKSFPQFNLKYASALNRLSGGERRLIEVYVIVKSTSQFILLDEPFTHIMPLHIDRIKEILLEEKKTKGILVTDLMFKHITDISDSLYVLNNGKTHLTKSVNDIERFGYARI